MAPRKPADERLDDLLNAAAALFAAKGFRRTRIEEIAVLAGVSAGNVYNYVTGKDALFRLVMERAIEGEGWQPSGIVLPIDGPRPQETVEWVAKRLNFVRDFPVLEAALAEEDTEDPAGEVTAVVAELFDVLLRTRYASAILERSGPDMPELRDMFLAVRRELFARMTRYVAGREAAGVFKPLGDARATARLLVEATSWATRGRLNDPDPKTHLSDEAARAALVELAVRTLVGEKTERRRRSPPKEGRNAHKARTPR